MNLQRQTSCPKSVSQQLTTYRKDKYTYIIEPREIYMFRLIAFTSMTFDNQKYIQNIGPSTQSLSKQRF